MEVGVRSEGDCVAEGVRLRLLVVEVVGSSVGVELQEGLGVQEGGEGDQDRNREGLGDRVDVWLRLGVVVVLRDTEREGSPERVAVAV